MRFKKPFFFVIVVVYTCFDAVGQVGNIDADTYFESNQDSTAETTLDDEAELLEFTQELTAEEAMLIKNTAGGEATQAEQMSAKTVCEEKCPSCFDGIGCDLNVQRSTA